MRYIRSCIIVGLLLFASHTHALIINEIMYDLEGTDTDREWIEVYNDGAESIDLATYKFFESSSNHGLTPIAGGSALAVGAYAIIADTSTKFMQDWPNFSGILFDSSFSLTNDPGETLALKDASGAVIDQVTYDPSVGASGDGTTLNRSGSSFVAAVATPGAVNTSSPPPGGGGSGSDGEPSVAPSVTSTKKIVEYTEPKISAEIVLPSIVFAGMPVEIKPVVRGYSNEILTRGTFSFMYGDGGVFDTDTTSNQIFYTYTYPGEYVLTFEYKRNPYMPTVDATDRMIVRVVPLTAILTLGEDMRSVIIENKTNFEINLKGWNLVTDNGEIIPIQKSVIVLPNKSLTLSLSALGYQSAISTPITLYDQSQKIIATTKKFIANTPSFSTKTSTPQVPTPKTQSSISPDGDGNIASTLAAQVISANEEYATPSSSRSLLIFGILGLLILGGAVGVYLIRLDKKDSVVPGDDFEITE